MALSRDEIIAIASRVNTFIKDDIIVAVFADLQQQYYEQFVQSEDTEGLLKARSKVQVLEDLRKSLAILVDHGTMAQKEIEREDREAASSRARGPRPPK